MLQSKALIFINAFVAAFFIGSTAALAQYPDKPIRVVVPFPPGGITDFVARAVTPIASKQLGQAIVIENRAGVGGVLGTGQVAESKPDGYTIMLGTISVLAINAALFSNLPYDPEKSFDMLTLATRAPNVLVVHPEFDVKTVDDLIKYLKANPDRVAFGNSGTGSSDHLSTELFWQKTGTRGVHVPFQGSGPSVTSLLGGHTQASFRNLAEVTAHIKGGKLRLIAVATDKRLTEFPDTPTLNETGVTGAEVYSWQGFVAPKGLPPDIRKKVHDALVYGLNDAGVKKALADRGVEAVPSTPEEFAQFQRDEIVRWKAVVKAGNITGTR